MTKDITPWANQALATAPASLTTDSMRSIPDKDIEEYLADRLWDMWESHHRDTDAFLKRLPAGAHAFFITWLIEAEVENGGFHQLFWNGHENTAKQAPLAFEYFDAAAHADVVRAALTSRKAEAGWMRVLRVIGNYAWSLRMSKLHAFDEAFYKLPAVLSPLRISKIRSCPDMFVPHASTEP